LPDKLILFVGDDVYTWIKQGLLAGTLQDSKLKIKQNLSKSSDKVIVLLFVRCHPLQAIYCWPYW
jgi:hypothetical protein